MHRRLPTAEEGLDVLVRRPADWPGHIPWKPFLEIPEVPRDGWGNQYIYVLDPELVEGFGIYSCGRDGASSSAGYDRDDLNTWSFEGSWHAYYGNREGRESRWCNAIALSIIWVTVVAASTWWTINTGTYLRMQNGKKPRAGVSVLGISHCGFVWDLVLRAWDFGGGPPFQHEPAT